MDGEPLDDEEPTMSSVDLSASTSELSLNTSDVLRELEDDFGQNTENDLASSSISSLSCDDILQERFPPAPDLTRNIADDDDDDYARSGEASDLTDTESDLMDNAGPTSSNNVHQSKFMTPDSVHRTGVLDDATDAGGSVPSLTLEYDSSKATASSVCCTERLLFSDSAKTSCSSLSVDDDVDSNFLETTTKEQLEPPTLSCEDETTPNLSFPETDSLFEDGSEPISRVDTLSGNSDELSTDAERYLDEQLDTSNPATECLKLQLLTKLSLRLSPTAAATPVTTPAAKQVNVDEGPNTTDVVNFFLKRKLQLLRMQQQKSSAVLDHSGDLSRLTPSPSNAMHTAAIPEPWMNQLQWAKLQANINKLKTTPIHTVRDCSSCMRVQFCDEETKVMRSLVHRARAPSMDARIEEHLINNDSITLIGNLARSLPSFHPSKQHKNIPLISSKLLQQQRLN